MSNNLPFSETSLTEIMLNVIAVSKITGLTLEIYKSKEEAKNGADWLLIFVNGTDWIGLRVQSKKVKSKGKKIIKYYEKLVYKNKYGLQHDLLIADAKLYGLMPIHCFYNYSDNLSEVFFSNSCSSETNQAINNGCTIMSSENVRALHLADQALKAIKRKKPITKSNYKVSEIAPYASPFYCLVCSGHTGSIVSDIKNALGKIGVTWNDRPITADTEIEPIHDDFIPKLLKSDSLQKTKLPQGVAGVMIFKQSPDLENRK